MRDGVVADMDTAVLYEAQSVKLDDPAHYWNYFFKMHRFLPDECALFARGYPKLSDAVLKATIEQAAYKSIDEPIYMPKAMVSEPLVSWSTSSFSGNREMVQSLTRSKSEHSRLIVSRPFRYRRKIIC